MILLFTKNNNFKANQKINSIFARPPGNAASHLCAATHMYYIMQHAVQYGKTQEAAQKMKTINITNYLLFTVYCLYLYFTNYLQELTRKDIIIYLILNLILQ